MFDFFVFSMVFKMGTQNCTSITISLYLKSLDTDFEVGYLYEFVVEFSYNLHLRFSFK